ncbi:MAG: ribonuclease E/G, partial [Alphaproteobacteria bacterium]|nr:ribonuclease E/G [Alphaproteobacteria bacterium]
LKTNLEAASEVGRQLRLRDLAGLVVIDFIDMDENRNNRAVERRMKDALKDDRARIQVGRISSFGLMELSRQRLRPSLFEASTKVCEICAGSGFVRTTESTALHVLRSIEEEGIRGRAAQLTVHAPPDVSLYMLNQKRENLAEIEQRYGIQIYVLGDETLVAPDCRITVDQTRTAQEIEEIERERRRNAESIPQPDYDDDDDVAIAEADADADDTADNADNADSNDEEKPREKRPRRRRRSRRRGEECKAEGENNGETDETGAVAAAGTGDAQAVASAGETDSDIEGGAAGDSEEKPRHRRRGRRGGRRRRAGAEQSEQAEITEAVSDDGGANVSATAEAETADAPTWARGDGTAVVELDGNLPSEDTAPEDTAPTASVDTTVPPAPAAPIGFTASGMTKGDGDGNSGEVSAEDSGATVEAAPEPAPEMVAEPEPDSMDEPVETASAGEPDKPKRRGWWQRGGLF